MKTNRSFVIAAALALGAWTVCAQDTPPPSRPPGGEPRPDGPVRHHVPPLFAALDTNHDGVIDADELAKAGEVLRKLDANGDGKITLDEIRPPQGPHGDQAGPRDPQAGAAPRHEHRHSAGNEFQRPPMNPPQFGSGQQQGPPQWLAPGGERNFDGPRPQDRDFQRPPMGPPQFGGNQPPDGPRFGPPNRGPGEPGRFAPGAGGPQAEPREPFAQGPRPPGMQPPGRGMRGRGFGPPPPDQGQRGPGPDGGQGAQSHQPEGGRPPGPPPGAF